MAKSVKINEVAYENVPKIEVPLSEGTGNAEFWDTTGATGTAENVLVGKTVFGAAGALTGTMPDNGAQTEKIAKVADVVKIAKGYHNGTGTVAIDAAEQEKIKSGNIKSGTTILGVAGSATVVDTADANATASNIIEGQTAYVGGKKLTGTLTTVKVTQDSVTKALSIA